MVTPDPSANEAGAAPGRRSIVDTAYVLLSVAVYGLLLWQTRSAR